MQDGMTRDIVRKIADNDGVKKMFAPMLSRTSAVLHQQQRQRGRKVYSLHAPEVECFGTGKTHRPYEFGVKASIATPLKHAKGGQFVNYLAYRAGDSANAGIAAARYNFRLLICWLRFLLLRLIAAWAATLQLNPA